MYPLALLTANLFATLPLFAFFYVFSLHLQIHMLPLGRALSETYLILLFLLTARREGINVFKLPSSNDAQAENCEKDASSACCGPKGAITQHITSDSTSGASYLCHQQKRILRCSLPRFTPSSLVYQVSCVGSIFVTRPVVFALLFSCQVLLPLEQVPAVLIHKGNRTET